ncbi:hypothetical protein MGLY_17330 [Neomoorella glycerini]|uniref:CRISPR-associated protein Cas5 n=1 Tax=Neomoorella glycerini TaxID=55779 RepID=A0A6I5ZRI6_9FIRM|nr:CRISPR-associated protein Cas5 [Moorella glycerini]QGP92358.1 hypothetical protein MGLY_17330 [Moorella glycerini]
MADCIKILSFSLRGKIAHFRQPDTVVTQATYPFPPRPTLHGLLASIMGIDFSTEEGRAFLRSRHFLGLSLLAPVRTICSQMSLLGKAFVSGNGNTFNRPTVIEMLVNPHYRIFYSGDWIEKLATFIRERRSVYHTYLGSAYCLTFPEYEDIFEAELLNPDSNELFSIATVVPREIVTRIDVEAGATYAAARAMPYCHNGGRIFEGTVTVFYETRGGPLKVALKNNASIEFYTARLPGGEVVCLW